MITEGIGRTGTAAKRVITTEGDAPLPFVFTNVEEVTYHMNNSYNFVKYIREYI